MLFNSDGAVLLFVDCAGGEWRCPGDDWCVGAGGGEWFGDTDKGLVEVVGELDVGRALGLVLMLRLLTEFDPGVTASKADPRDPGRLYGENLCPFSPCIGEVGPCPE